MVHRLLVVAGDNEALRTLPNQLNDIEVTLIESANEALWEVRTSPPEAIIADTQLSEMNGLEIAEILPGFAVPTRLILWDRVQDQATQQKAQALGVYRLLCGDVATDELHTAIREAIADAAAAPPPAPEPAEPAEVVEPEAVPAQQTNAKSAAPEPPHAAEPERPQSARVRLPARNERSEGTGGLGARARAAAERNHEAAQPAASHAQPSSASSRRFSGNMVVTSENLNSIRGIMSQLSQELGPQCILLTDRAGMVLVEVGSQDKLPTMILLPLLSTSFSTAGEVARQLGEEDATTLYIHEGVNYDLYCFDVAQRFLLVLVFNKKVASSKIGAVWVNTKRAIRELQDVLS
jgi:DNA-binding NarL/FixJ family response regulator